MSGETRYTPGDILVNTMAAKDNPRRVGMVKAIRSRTVGINVGRYYEMSDFRGDGWTISVDYRRLAKIGHFDILDGPRKALDQARACLRKVKDDTAHPHPREQQ